MKQDAFHLKTILKILADLRFFRFAAPAPVLAVPEDTADQRAPRIVPHIAMEEQAADKNAEPVSRNHRRGRIKRKDLSPPRPRFPKGTKTILRDSEKKALLAIARKTIEQYLTDGSADLPADVLPELRSKCGAFVTLRSDNKLRGCVGRISGDRPLYEVVGSMAIQAAVSDPRFLPVTLEELPKIEIEISVLTPLSEITAPEEIVIGRDGVLLQKEGHQAVFLPQVATTMGWDRQQILEQLCRKAKLPPGSWKESARLYIFQAEVFQESEFDLQ